MARENQAQEKALIRVDGLALAYGSRLVLHDVGFSVHKGDVFIIMGVNGCGKSTLLKSMIGLLKPLAGRVFYEDASFWDSGPAERSALLQRIGILYQKNALFSSMTLAENVALPLQEYTDLSPKQVGEIVSFKLKLVGLSGFEGYAPAELSGGMQKRAALARAMALDPDILFFDEPSSGLDPVSAGLLDELICELNSSLKTTIVVISHDLASIFAIGDEAIFLDPEAKTVIASGNPTKLLHDCPDPRVRTFLTRGEGRSEKQGF